MWLVGRLGREVYALTKLAYSTRLFLMRALTNFSK